MQQTLGNLSLELQKLGSVASTLIERNDVMTEQLTVSL